MAPKRKATSPVRPSPSKKQNTSTNGHDDNKYNPNRIAEKYGIINRDFYPPEMSNERCEQYNKNQIPRPIHVLESTIKGTKSQREKVKVGDCVIHWFKRDLRIDDNTALSLACQKAREGGVPLVCMFLVSPQDYEAHLTSPARVDFDLRNLEILKEELGKMNVPLYTSTIEERKDVPTHIVEKCKEWGAKHVFCNIEYEVDELRRETKLTTTCLKEDINFTAVHDDVVVPPGHLMSGSGNQYSVYSPWYRAWVKHIHAHPYLLNCAAEVTPNDPSTKSKKPFASLFEISIPSAPSKKALSDADRKRLASYWPAGPAAAHDRLQRFLKEKVKAYKDTRNFPSQNSTSLLSPHLAAGTLSARTAIRAAKEVNSAKALDAGTAGIVNWISEIAWRDFYKHVLCHWPYVCMSKAFKYEYNDIEWEYDDEAFQRWCDGQTGFPIVDAAMRQVKEMSYMHNRCRMIVASFLAKDLLIDWRMGEKFFMQNLIDGDFASNNGGWGFSASTGVDPQPYFRIFNPTLQSEKFDAEGEYIRKWVPELRNVKGKAIHEPYARGAGKEAAKAGYQKPMVEHKEVRQRALERYKAGLGRGTANVGGGVHN